MQGPEPRSGARLAAATATLAAAIGTLALRADTPTYIDAGELAAGAHTLGIVHPTGYPLFTWLGRLASLLPLGTTVAARLTALGSLAFAGGIGLATYTAARRLSGAWPATVAGLTLAAAAPIVDAARVVEVHGVAWVAVVSLVHLSVRATEPVVATEPMVDDARRVGAVRAAAGARISPALFAYSSGLAVTCHGVIAPLVPLLAVPVLAARRAALAAGGRDKPHAAGNAGAFAGAWGILASCALATVGLVFAPIWRGTLVLGMSLAGVGILRSGIGALELGRWFGWALVGLSVTAYLPIRAAGAPQLNWGDPTSFGAFWNHISGSVYHVWYMTGVQAALANLERFLGLVHQSFSAPGVVIAAAGGVVLARRRSPWALVSATCVVANVAYASQYDIHDIHTYFFPSLAILSGWLAVGLASIAGRFPGRHAVRVGLLLVPALVLFNTARVPRAPATFVADYTRSMFAALEEGAVLLSRQWDSFVSAAIYSQIVDGERLDVTLIEKELMRRSWYLTQLERQDPTLCAPCAEAFGRFRAALVPFESGRRYDASLLQQGYVGAIHCLLGSAEARGRPIYATPDALEGGIGAAWMPVVVGLPVRLYRTPPADLPAFTTPVVRGITEASRSADPQDHQLANLVGQALFQRARLEASAGQWDSARARLGEVLALDAKHKGAVELLRQIEATRQGVTTGRGDPRRRAPELRHR